MILITLVLISCQTGKFMSIEDIKKTYGLEKEPSQSDFPESDAIIIYENHDNKMRISDQYELENYESVHIIKKLFKNIENYASVEIPIYDSEKLLNISARIVKVDGSSIILDKKDFFTISGRDDNSTFYADTQTTKFTFPAIEKDCIIEYMYKKKTKYPFRFETWQFQHYIPTMINNYSLTFPKVLVDELDWSWRFKTYNYINIGKPLVTYPNPHEESIIDQKINYSWFLKDIPAFIPESMMPPHSRYKAFVKFAPSEWKKWNDITKWYYKDLFKPKLVITKKIKSLATKLTELKTDNEDKIKELYHYIQNLRYVSIQLGVGSIQPSYPQTVLDREYGDCKDKSILLISLLKSIGITAKPVLVLTASEGVIDPDFPSWSFNHMIVKAEADGVEYWLDPTVKYSSLNELPWVDEGIDVLVINDDGTSQIETTSGSTFQENVTDVNIDVIIENQDKVTYKIRIQYKGELNFENKNFFEDKTEKEVKEFCKSIIMDEFLNAEIQNCSFSELDLLDSDFILNYDFTVSNGLLKQGDLYFLNTTPFKLIGSMRWLLEDSRLYPIEFPYPETNRIKLSINYPANVFSIRNIPENTEFSTEELSYLREIDSSGNGLIKLNQNLIINSFLIPPHHYQETKAFFESIRSSLENKLIFIKNN